MPHVCCACAAAAARIKLCASPSRPALLCLRVPSSKDIPRSSEKPLCTLALVAAGVGVDSRHQRLARAVWHDTRDRMSQKPSRCRRVHLYASPS